MFKPGPSKWNLLLLSLAVCFFFGAHAAPDVGAQSCSMGQTLPGEADTTGLAPVIDMPDEEFQKPNEGCTSYGISSSGGSPPYRVVEVTGTGVTLDRNNPNGNLVCSNACGAFEVTIGDSIGRTAKRYGRITDSNGNEVGVWAYDVTIFDQGGCPSDYKTDYCERGQYRYVVHHRCGQIKPSEYSDPCGVSGWYCPPGAGEIPSYKYICSVTRDKLVCPP